MRCRGFKSDSGLPISLRRSEIGEPFVRARLSGENSPRLCRGRAEDQRLRDQSAEALNTTDRLGQKAPRTFLLFFFYVSKIAFLLRLFCFIDCITVQTAHLESCLQRFRNRGCERGIL